MSWCNRQIPAVETSAAQSETVSPGAIRRTAGRGALWQIGGGFWHAVVRMGASIVLARVLTPSDYGLVGMAVLARGFIQCAGSLGIGIGIVVKRNLSEEDIDTAFWINLLVQVALAGICYAVAPLAGSFFGSPRLTGVLRIMLLAFLLTGLGAVSSSLLEKRMRFRTITLISGSTIVLESALAIVLAVWFRASYWTLVISMLVGSAWMYGAMIVCARWRPRLRVSRASCRHLLHFGLYGQGFTILNYLHQNVDYLVVGWLLGSARLGIYEFAYRIPHMLYDRVARPVGATVLPAMSAVQDNDRHLSRGYIEVARHLAIAIMPALVILAATARPTLMVLWGPQWLPAAVPLQLLCLSGAIRSLMTPLGSIFVCKNQLGLLFRYYAITLVLTLALVSGLGAWWGLNGVAIGMVLSLCPSVYVTRLALRMTGSRFSQLLVALMPPMIASGLAGLAAMATVYLGQTYGAADLVILLTAVTAGAATYVLALRLCFPETVQQLVATARLLLGRGQGPAEPMDRSVPLTSCADRAGK